MFIPTYAGTGMLTGCYDIPFAYANVKGVYTNTNPTDAYRGAPLYASVGLVLV